jgi:hypothetical protein
MPATGVFLDSHPRQEQEWTTESGQLAQEAVCLNQLQRLPAQRPSSKAVDGAADAL